MLFYFYQLRMGEVPVLDFQTQQHKLFVQLATAYALQFSGKHCMNLYYKVTNQIEKGHFEQLPLVSLIIFILFNCR